MGWLFRSWLIGGVVLIVVGGLGSIASSCGQSPAATRITSDTRALYSRLLDDEAPEVPQPRTTPDSKQSIPALGRGQQKPPQDSSDLLRALRRLHELNRLSVSYPAEIDFHSDAELTARVSNPESELADKVLSIQLRSDSFSVLPADPVPLTLANGQERRFIARPTQYGLRRVLVSVSVNGPPNPLPKGVSLSSALDDWSIAIRVREPTRLLGIPEFYFNVTLVSGIVVLLLSAVGWMFVRVFASPKPPDQPQTRPDR